MPIVDGKEARSRPCVLEGTTVGGRTETGSFQKDSQAKLQTQEMRCVYVIPTAVPFRSAPA